MSIFDKKFLPIPSKGVWIFIAVFVGISLYIRFLDGQRREKLTTIATPILQLCQINHQCPDQKTVELNRDKFLLKNTMMYYKTKNQQNSFTISWWVATGTTFVATGGVDEPLIIEKEMD